MHTEYVIQSIMGTNLLTYMLVLLVAVYFVFLVLQGQSSTTLSQSFEQLGEVQFTGLGALAGFGLVLCYVEGLPLSSMAAVLLLTAFDAALFGMLDTLWASLRNTTILTGVKVNRVGNNFLAGLSSLLVYQSVLGRRGLLFLGLANCIHVVFYSLNFTLAELMGAEDPGHCLRLFVFAGVEGMLIACLDTSSRDRAPSSRNLVHALIGGSLIWATFPALNSFPLPSTHTLRRSLSYLNTLLCQCSSTLLLTSCNYLVRGKIEPASFVYAGVVGGVGASGFASLAGNLGVAVGVGGVVGAGGGVLNLWAPLKYVTSSVFRLEEALLFSSLVSAITGIIVLSYNRSNFPKPA
jgi:hypothetical protein